MKSNTIRTRFAPSPSGFLHIGGARTALFNYLHAKANKGQFIIRVEDTDQERSSKESENTILTSLSWLGIKADEGPLEGGDFGPYRQSERLNIYQKYTEKLLAQGKVYHCFCTDEELETKQKQAKILGKPYIYDGKCRNLDKKEIETRIKDGEKYVVRFKTKNTELKVKDLIQGTVKFDSKLIGDFIIVKSDGFPSYNYAVVIDDYEMRITNVIRGVGHLSNTPRQMLIHQALEIELPIYAHISEIVGTDRKKLSKRRGATSILMFRDMGYLADALNNYMSLLGWYPKDTIEYMPRELLEKKFELTQCSKSPAMFDFFNIEKNQKNDIEAQNEEVEVETASPPASALSIEELKASINKKSKLNWLNNLYLREGDLENLWDTLKRNWVPKDEFVKMLVEKEPVRLKDAFDKTRTYMQTFSEGITYLKELFREEAESLDEKGQQLVKDELSQKVVEEFKQEVLKQKPQQPEDYSKIIKTVGEKTLAKGPALFMPIRLATTGKMEGLELPILFSILGTEGVLSRLSSYAKINTPK